MRLFAVLLGCLLAASCATTPTVEPPRTDLLADARFAPSSERVDREDVFALSDEMRRHLRTEIAGLIREKGLHQGFFEALYAKGQLRLDYDSTMTRNAAQAFAAKSGNCLSLVIMTAAFAKALDVPVTYQSVYVDSWGRAGDVQLYIGHVNITLGRSLSEIGVSVSRASGMTIDFVPPQLTRGLPLRRISEDRIVAMYMNNRAAENFVAGRIDDAYWWARGAILADPSFTSAYNTLGVVYRRHGDLPEARAALAYALEREPDNPRVMSNFIALLKQTGEPELANALAQKLARIEPVPPFAYFDRGMKAMQSGDYRLARELFAKEVEREPFYHEFRYWLALAQLRLGDVDQARANLAFARDYSTTRKEQDLYSAKLEHLGATSLR